MGRERLPSGLPDDIAGVAGVLYFLAIKEQKRVLGLLLRDVHAAFLRKPVWQCLDPFQESPVIIAQEIGRLCPSLPRQ